MAAKNPSSLQTLTPSSSRVCRETIGKAINALLKWTTSKSQQQKQKPHHDLLYLVVTLKKIPQIDRTNPYKIPLPHPLQPFDLSQQICLIIDDRSKNLNFEIAKRKIDSEHVPVSKILKLSKLRSEYRAFESKNKLFDSFNLFFVDRRCVSLLPKLLGKSFCKKKKILIPIDLARNNWKEQMMHCCGSAILCLSSGTCSSVKVARVCQSCDEIVSNVVAAIEGVAEVVPKRWENVRSLHLKALDSLALPIYQSAASESGLKMEEIEREEEGRRDVIVKSSNKKGRIGEV